MEEIRQEMLYHFEFKMEQNRMIQKKEEIAWALEIHREKW